MRKKCLNTEFFLARIFAHSDWIRRDTEYLLLFSPNPGKYGPEKTLYLDTFHEVTALLSYLLYATLSFFLLLQIFVNFIHQQYF